MQALAEEQSGPLGEEHLELLCEVARRSYAEMNLGLAAAGGLGADEWVHLMLLRSSAPSHLAAAALNRRLCRALSEDSALLGQLHSAFEAADVDGRGVLPEVRWEAAIAEVVGRLPAASAAGVEDVGTMSYYGFVSHVLGAEPAIVELALYDLSQGFARWVPASLLGGHRFEGVWHSGVRVFGKEFWYGGVILESDFDDSPFGKPARVLNLGKTLSTRAELLEFIRNDVCVDYNPRRYDVLRKNCNHFSNELVQFLLHGAQIPEEVLMQPEWARNAKLVQYLRPLMNRHLGSFGDGPGTCGAECGGSPSSPYVVSRIDDLTEEWRSRLQIGDIVLHRARFIDRAWVVRIVGLAQARGGGGGTADISFFQPAAARWEDACLEVATRRGVAVREFYPLLDQAEAAGVQILKAGLLMFSDSDPRLGDMLRRPRSASAWPTCSRGHKLHPEPPQSWFRQAPACSICGERASSSDQREQCAKCSFVVCRHCLERGKTLPGGGAFADMLSRPLAEAILKDFGWLRYKASVYFFKADHNATGLVDKSKAKRVGARLRLELGVEASCGAEPDLVLEMRRRRSGAEGAAGQGAAEGGGEAQLDEEAFFEVFRAALAKAVVRLRSEAGPASASREGEE